MPRSADWVLLAVKAHQTESAAAWLKATVGPNTRLAVLQNGVEHIERVTPYVPAGTQILPVIIQLPAQRTAPGAITLYGRSNLIVPDSEAGREFADLFADTFMAMDVREDFVTAAWEKLCLNVASGAVTALTLRTDAVAHVPGMKDLTTAIIAECMAVGRAEGANFAPDFADAMLAFLSRPNYRGNSMYYDRRDGKPLEWDARNGAVARIGRKHGVPTPDQRCPDPAPARLRSGGLALCRLAGLQLGQFDRHRAPLRLAPELERDDVMAVRRTGGGHIGDDGEDRRPF